MRYVLIALLFVAVISTTGYSYSFIPGSYSDFVSIQNWDELNIINDDGSLDVTVVIRYQIKKDVFQYTNNVDIQFRPFNKYPKHIQNFSYQICEEGSPDLEYFIPGLPINNCRNTTSNYTVVNSTYSRGDELDGTEKLIRITFDNNSSIYKTYIIKVSFTIQNFVDQEGQYKVVWFQSTCEWSGNFCPGINQIKRYFIFPIDEGFIESKPYYYREERTNDGRTVLIKTSFEDVTNTEKIRFSKVPEEPIPNSINWINFIITIAGFIIAVIMAILWWIEKKDKKNIAFQLESIKETLKNSIGWENKYRKLEKKYNKLSESYQEALKQKKDKIVIPHIGIRTKTTKDEVVSIITIKKEVKKNVKNKKQTFRKKSR